MEDNNFDKDNYGSMWIEKDAKVVRKGSFFLEGHKFYGMVVEKVNDKGQTQYEFYQSLGLLHINKPEEKLSSNSPDMGGRVKSPLWGQKDKENKLAFKTWKLGLWARESESGVPYSSLGLQEIDEVNDDLDTPPNEPKETGKPQF